MYKIKITLIALAISSSFQLKASETENTDSDIMLGVGISGLIPISNSDANTAFGFTGTAKWFGDDLGIGISHTQGESESEVNSSVDEEYTFTSVQLYKNIGGDGLFKNAYWLVGYGHYTEESYIEWGSYSETVELDGTAWEVGLGERFGKNGYGELTWYGSDADKGGLIFKLGWRF